MAREFITSEGKTLIAVWDRDTEIIIGQLAKKHGLTYTEVGRINRIIFKVLEGKSSNESSIERYFRKGT